MHQQHPVIPQLQFFHRIHFLHGELFFFNERTEKNYIIKNEKKKENRTKQNHLSLLYKKLKQ